ncbi:hypothetical protein J6590_013570 [Homalodisca vitripennis]|nr:hypothetical protein J6590_013570 [Homalodisca vitripennis]
MSPHGTWGIYPPLCWSMDGRVYAHTVEERLLVDSQSKRGRTLRGVEWQGLIRWTAQRCFYVGSPPPCG